MPAEVGRSHVQRLAPFADPDGDPLTISVSGTLPPGLSVLWLPDGSVQIGGIATAAGDFGFDIIARDPAGAESRVAVAVATRETGIAPIRILPEEARHGHDAGEDAVAPEIPASRASAPDDRARRPAPAPQPPENVSPSPGFPADHEGAPCVLSIRRTDGEGRGTIEVFAASAEVAAALPASDDPGDGTLSPVVARPVTEAQCPAVAFLAGLGRPGPQPPSIRLDTGEAVANAPVAGSIAAPPAGGLTVFLVADDGEAWRLDSLLEPAEGGARFSLSVQADRTSEGRPQLLVAVVTDRALADLPDAGPAEEVFARLASIIAAAGATAAADAETFRILR